MSEKKSFAFLVRQAEKFERDRKFLDAKDSYTSILQKYPKNDNIKRRIYDLEKRLSKQDSFTMPATLLSTAINAFSSGKHDEAISIATQLISQKQDVAHAHNLVGVVHHTRGHLSQAAKSFLEAINNDEFLADAYNNYGMVLYTQGALDQAIKYFEQAIKINPFYVEANNNLGNTFFKLKDWANATVSYRNALKVSSDNLDAITNLAATLKSRGGVNELLEASSLCERALEMSPYNKSALLTLGSIAKEQKQFTKSLSFYEKAKSISQDDALIMNNLGNLYLEMGELRLAILNLDGAVKLDPNYHEAHNNLGTALLRVGRHIEAFDHLKLAVAQYTKDPLYYKNLGDCLRYLGQIDDAEEHYLLALKQNDNFYDATSALAILYAESERLDDAETRLVNAVEKHPNSFELQTNLANIFFKKKNYPKALSLYEKIVRNGVVSPIVLNNLGLTLVELKDYESASNAFLEALRIDSSLRITNLNLAHLAMKKFDPLTAIEFFKIAIRPPVLGNITPSAFSNFLFCLNYSDEISDDEIFSWHRSYNDLIKVNDNECKEFQLQMSCSINKIKLGFVSGDFYSHSVSFFILPVLERINRDFFDITLYYSGTEDDHVTNLFRDVDAEWREVHSLRDLELAELISNDGIDVLFDLSGHTGRNRLPVFALKPAPVQINWMGYPNTTGLTQMDYRITDEFTDPSGVSDDYCTEKLIRINPFFLVYRPPAGLGEIKVCEPPVLTNKHISFGSFNNFSKINEGVLECWLKILRRCHSSVLYLKSSISGDSEAFRERFHKLLTKYEAEANNIIFLDRTHNQLDHLALYKLVDIALDTFPYSGTTTTLEALYMGVPVLSLAGNRHASRVSGSILSCLDLDYLISKDPNAYIENAVLLAADFDHLKILRQNLRSLLLNGPLMDEVNFVKKFEDAVYKIVDSRITFP